MPDGALLLPGLEVAAGSVTGRDHVMLGRSNQDGWTVRSTPEATVAVVCDGCGSAPSSEVGARIGAHLVASATLAYATRDDATLLAEVTRDVTAHLRLLASAMGRHSTAVVTDHLLFTVVAALVTPRHTLVFGAGDGIAMLNGRLSSRTYPGNAPPYLGHGLLPGASPVALERWDGIDTPRFESLLLATDGAADLWRDTTRRLPGTTEVVGDPARLWGEDGWYGSPVRLGRWLARCNRPVDHVDWDARRRVRATGLLHDDTTIVVLRRRRGPT